MKKNWGWTKNRNITKSAVPLETKRDTKLSSLTLDIMSHPGYRQADQDTDFMGQGNTRGLRLQADYLKAELLLKQHGIQHTIVAFGGTRIIEPLQATRRLEDLIHQLTLDPENSELMHQVRVARRVCRKSSFYQIARDFGRLVGLSGDGSTALMTGGGPGIMEAANRGAYDVGAKSIGLNVNLPFEQFPNPYITPELCFCFHYFAIRKLHFMLRAKALVAFPGGYGTLDELFGALTLVQTSVLAPLPIVLVGQEFWANVFNIDFLVNEGVISPEDRDLFSYAETAEEIWRTIQDWHASREDKTPNNGNFSDLDSIE
jgi:uncharacterized protein (TIGR00730 family)